MIFPSLFVSMVQSYHFAESRNNYLQHPAKNYDEHIDNGGENAKKKRRFRTWAALMSLQRLIKGDKRTLFYHWSSANRVGRVFFYLRFRNCANKMKVKVDPIKGDEWGDPHGLSKLCSRQDRFMAKFSGFRGQRFRHFSNPRRATS